MIYKFTNSYNSHKKDIQVYKCDKCKNLIFIEKNIGSNHLKYSMLCFSIVGLNLLIELLISDLPNTKIKVLQNTLRLTSHFNILIIFYIFNNYVFKHKTTHFDKKFEKFSTTIYSFLMIYFIIMLIVNLFEYRSNSIINYDQMQFITNKDLILLTHTFLGLVTIQNIYHVSHGNNLINKIVKYLIK